jgi:hypothetical protein
LHYLLRVSQYLQAWGLQLVEQEESTTLAKLELPENRWSFCKCLLLTKKAKETAMTAGPIDCEKYQGT